MKLQAIVMGLGLLAASMGWSAEGSRWKGEGIAFDSRANSVESYSLELTIRPLGNGVTETHARVLLADGRIEEHRSVSTKKGNGFVIEGDEKGGGYCFGDGLCQTYVQDKYGIGYAAVLVMDGENQMRLLRTELKGEEVLGYYRENFTRLP